MIWNTGVYIPIATTINASLNPPAIQSDNQCAPLTKRAVENRIAKNHTIVCIRTRFDDDNEFDDRLIIVDMNKDQMRLTAVCSPGQLKWKIEINIRSIQSS